MTVRDRHLNIFIYVFRYKSIKFERKIFIFFIYFLFCLKMKLAFKVIILLAVLVAGFIGLPDSPNIDKKSEKIAAKGIIMKKISSNSILSTNN